MPTYCPICHEPVLPQAETGWLHVHYADEILTPERIEQHAFVAGRRV